MFDVCGLVQILTIIVYAAVPTILVDVRRLALSVCVTCVYAFIIVIVMVGICNINTISVVYVVTVFRVCFFFRWFSARLLVTLFTFYIIRIDSITVEQFSMVECMFWLAGMRMLATGWLVCLCLNIVNWRLLLDHLFSSENFPYILCRKFNVLYKILTVFYHYLITFLWFPQRLNVFLNYVVALHVRSPTNSTRRTKTTEECNRLSIISAHATMILIAGAFAVIIVFSIIIKYSTVPVIGAI